MEIDDDVDAESQHAGARPKKRKKLYDLSPADNFWVAQKGSPFPEVAEAVQLALESYRSEEEQVKMLKSAMVRCSHTTKFS